MDKIANIVIEYTIDEHNKLKVDGFVTRASADKMAVYYLQLLEAENRADDEVTTAATSDLSQDKGSENAPEDAPKKEGTQDL